jgi:hypothetical protein
MADCGIFCLQHGKAGRYVQNIFETHKGKSEVQNILCMIWEVTSGNIYYHFISIVIDVLILVWMFSVMLM